MKPSRRNHNRMLTGAVIGISVIGILYFGYRAVSENSKAINENPFEYNYDTFKKIDPALLKYSEISRISLDMQKVSGIAVASDYTMYVTGDETVVIMDADGHVLSSVKTGETAHCLDVDFNGDMYCAMNDHIEVYDREGNQKARWESPGEGALTASIAVSEEHVYLADAGNRIVWKYDKSGNVVSRIGERDEDKDIPGFIVPSPYFDVDIDPDGFLWVVNPGRHTLENYTPEGDLRSSWGEFSMDIDGFCGCCNPTHITIMEDGNFVTSEKGIPRVKVYNGPGALESVVAGPDLFAEGTQGLDLASDSMGRIYVLDPVKKAVMIFERNIPGV